MRSLSGVWKDRRRAWSDTAAEGCRVDSSRGGNIEGQMPSRAPRWIARWLLSGRAEIKSPISAAEGVEASMRGGSSGMSAGDLVQQKHTTR